MGEVQYGVGEAKGAPDHPHRGFETVTYMIDGEFIHRDSTGGGGIIANGDTQWMTAGAGIVHSEMPPEKLIRSGGLFHGVQLWVNLPAAKKFSPPGYQDIAASSVTLLRSHDGGALVRVIAGALGDHNGPGVTQTPITYAHVTLAPGSRLEVPWRPDFNGLVYALGGFGSVGAERVPLQSGQLAVLGDGDALRIEGGPQQDSRTPSFDVLLLGGLPIGEPVVQYGPFVMNTREEILQAVADYQSGKMGSIPATHFGAGPRG
jgi:redox-sensitive bicupin YhaK (pirin superfamily)